VTLQPGAAIPKLGVSGPVALSMRGTENITTGLGIFQATRLSAERNYSILTGRLDLIKGTFKRSEWYVCGYGLVKLTSSDEGIKIPGDYPYSSREDLILFSFTPLSLNEAHVRYILADIESGDLGAYYRANIPDEETAEALRRWDAGIRITNIANFERKELDGQALIVYAGTGIPVKGLDIKLTSEAQQ